ncbi:MAG: hypothetical protein IKU19_04995 [Clostridia bacterium]|nr:hypothetical protein [Clostridia bacterium]
MKVDMNNDNGLIVGDPAGAPAVEEELKFRTPKKIVKKKRLLAVLFVLLGLIAAGALCFGAYMLFGPEKGYDDSAAFYFSSDLLSEEGKEYIVYDTIDFNVYNYADALRVSKEPVEDFSVTVKADGKDITARSEISMGERAMAADVRSGCAVSVSVPEKYNDKIIEITVKSFPVEKELKASFKLEPAWGYSVNDEKGNVCAELVIFANKDVSLEFSWDGEKLIPDSTDSYIRTAEDGENKCNISLSGGMSITVPMFKADPDKVIASDSNAIKLEAVKYTITEEEAPETEEASSETEEVSA